MTRIYGQRWQVSSGRPLAEGAQGEILRVTDLRGEFEGDYALKHVLKPRRHERFSREIEAVTWIRHPNVIGLVDASAFADSSRDRDKQFVVMPIAEGGDLGHGKRAKGYKESMDTVIPVGKQLASALLAAHSVGVIHRDLKPSNVLFTGLEHEIWISDFGICLIRELPRLGKTDPPAAPHFMAPELEGGIQLDVTPAADVYSLGMVLYYLFSGGVILQPEQIGKSTFSSNFLQSKCGKLFYSLLQQMVCPLETRLKAIPEVLNLLEAIEACNRRA
jgi:serine/threonine protein kinase